MRTALDVNVNVMISARLMSGIPNNDPCPMTEKQSWGIQEFADLFEITPRAIRFYEDKGLLMPEREAGSRIFYETDHDRLARILRAKRLGFSLDDIKVVLDVTDGAISDREELALRRDNFKKVIRSLKRRHKDIKDLVTEMSDLCDAIDERLAQTEGRNNVSLMAEAFEMKFRPILADDFSNDNL